jgi:hypothetical protein
LPSSAGGDQTAPDTFSANTRSAPAAVRADCCASNVWPSVEHIESGAEWFTALSERLSQIHFGVLMVTKNNFKEPWLRFEAGALAKALDAEVTPVFCNLRLLDVVHYAFGAS